MLDDDFPDPAAQQLGDGVLFAADTDQQADLIAAGEKDVRRFKDQAQGLAHFRDLQHLLADVRIKGNRSALGLDDGDGLVHRGDDRR